METTNAHTDQVTRLVYQVAVGPPSKLYRFCMNSVAVYCCANDIHYIIQRDPILRIQPDPKTSGRSEGASRLGYLPIFEKENALAYLGEYDQVAVIDADVWIRPGAPNIFDELRPGADFAGCVEEDMPLTQAYARKVRNHGQAQFGLLDGVGLPYMNMGVMVMNKSLVRFLRGQTPREFLARPEFKKFIDGEGDWKWSTDQTLLNWWLNDCGAEVQDLRYRWNALYKAILPDKVREAHFVHFFLRDHLPGKGENVAELVGNL